MKADDDNAHRWQKGDGMIGILALIRHAVGKHTWEPTVFFVNIRGPGEVGMTTNWKCVVCGHGYATSETLDGGIAPGERVFRVRFDHREIERPVEAIWK